MSIFYYIELETEYDLSKCKDILLGDVRHEIITATQSKLTLSTEYFSLSLENVNNSKDAFSSELGIKPTISITIYRVVRKNENAVPELYRMFMRWVESSSDTAILLYEGEKVIILSQHDKLMRNDDPLIWRDDVNEVIDKEYTLRRFPTL
ncbi:MAG: hypothetical protein ACFE0Q_15420 [Anaerolineae bacterium]